MSKKFALILCGCGSMDGSEIQESTLCMYAIASHAETYEIFAPEGHQWDVMNFITKKPMNEKRERIVEAARIARGNIRPLSELKAEDFDALAFPGGVGTAKNLFTYALDGMNMRVMPEIEKVILSFYNAKKPVGAMCIAPVMLAKVLGDRGINVTVGPDTHLATELEKTFGARVTQVAPDKALTDMKNRVVTTPAYMYGDSNIRNVGLGADAMISSMLVLMK